MEYTSYEECSILLFFFGAGAILVLVRLKLQQEKLRGPRLTDQTGQSIPPCKYNTL